MHVSQWLWGEGTDTPFFPSPSPPSAVSFPFSFSSKTGTELTNGLCERRLDLLALTFLCPSLHETDECVDAAGSPEVWGPSPLQSGRERWFHKGGLDNHWAVIRPVKCCVDAATAAQSPYQESQERTQPLSPGRPWNDALWPTGYQRINVLY